MIIFKHRIISKFIKESLQSFRSNSCFTIKKYRILFFGSDDVALKSLKRVNELRKKESLVSQLQLVTANHSQHSSKIEKYAQSENLTILSWPVKGLKPCEFDIGIVVSFGHLIPEETISKFPLGMVNVHTSLLPRWRGAAPVVHTLLNGDELTGVTLMSIKPHQFDIGEIISQQSIPVSDHMTLPVLTEQLAELGAEMLVKCLHTLPECLLNARPQKEEGVTYAKKIDKSISRVKWDKMSAKDVYNLYRAIYGVYPLTTYFNNKALRLFQPFVDTNPSHQAPSHKAPGEIEYCGKLNAIKVLCSDRRYVCFRKLRIVGKREISAVDFHNGYMKKTSDKDLVFY